MAAVSLKIIAIVAMLIDHIGAFFFPQLQILRFIGRLTFPIMAYFIGEGFYYTRNYKKYLGTMIVFALISELAFDLALFGRVVDFGYQNVLWTFVLSLIALKIFSDNLEKSPIKAYLAVVAVALVADLISCDYGSTGVIIVVMLYYASKIKESKKGVATVLAVWCGIMFISSPSLWGNLGVLLTIPLLYCYNGKRGVSRDSLAAKYIFYAFYPLHLLIIAAVRWL